MIETNPPVDPRIRDAWRRIIATITDDEVAALLPLVRNGSGRLTSLVAAYRLGRRNASIDDAPFAGFQPCPNCLSVSVATVGFAPASGGVTHMVARCGHCGWRFNPATGEPHRTDSPDADRPVPTEPPDHSGPGS
jgi:hypothetical protein